MPWVRRDGVELSYSDSGCGQTFVFLHGLGGDRTQPAAQAPAGCRLITPECRGHGQSSLGPEHALSFHTFAFDVDALLDQLRLPVVILGGISMGAGVALALARIRPSRVRALVLVRPAWIDRPCTPNLQVFSEIADLLRRHGPAAGKRVFEATSTSYRRATGLSPAVGRSLLGQFDRSGAVERVAVLERLVPDRPVTPSVDWSALTMPALVIGTGHDSVHPFSYADWLHNRLPNSALRKVPPKDLDVAHRDAIADAIWDLLSLGCSGTRALGTGAMT